MINVVLAVKFMPFFILLACVFDYILIVRRNKMLLSVNTQSH